MGLAQSSARELKLKNHIVMSVIPVDHAPMELHTEIAIQAMCVKCPCGNFLFVGRAGEARRTRDAKFWNNLKCPTCTDSFTAYLDDVEYKRVPVLLFERGFCSPESLE